MNLPDPTPVIDLIEAFRRSKVMFAALALGVFEQLHEAAATADELAKKLSANADALSRLLDACCALGLLRKSGNLYSNEPVADTYLLSASAHSLHGYIRYSDFALYPMWGHLDSAVIEGTHRWKQVFGLESGGIFDHFFHEEAAMRDFLHGMHGWGALTAPTILSSFDLGRFGRLVDLGGATGHLAIAACERYPKLHATVFDLPRVAAIAREYVAASNASERIEVVNGDFFKDPLPPADLYSLGRILHDWTIEKINFLLRRIYDALPSGGALLIVEKLLNEGGVGPLSGNLQSLSMLIVTEGRERSLSEYTEILNRAGFHHIEGRRTGSWLDAVLALKP